MINIRKIIIFNDSVDKNMFKKEVFKSERMEYNE